VVEIEQPHTVVYQLDDKECTDILATLDEVKQGVVASDEEATTVLKRLR
jgi:hypothetical protein